MQLTFGAIYVIIYPLNCENQIYIDSFAGMMLSLRKTAVKCNSHHRQGISLSADSKARIDFEKTCGTDLFCNSVPSRCYKRETRKKTTRDCGLFAILKPFFNILCLTVQKSLALI